MANKVVAGLLASLLVVVVCAGAIITLVHSTKKATLSDLPSSLHTTSKAIITTHNSLCSTALHRESCELMLSKLAPKPSSSGRNHLFDVSLARSPSAQTQVFKSFIQVTLSELEAAVKHSADVANGRVAGKTVAAKTDCEKLLTDALQYARDAVALLGDKDIESLKADANDIGFKLTAAMTYMYTCVDGFHDPKLNAEMDHILTNATVTGSNALGVINSISSSVVKPKSRQAASRKLLGNDVDRRGYPTWLSTGERKLLEKSDSQKPDATVAQDGSGDYKTISEAIDAIPSSNTGRYVIYVKEGVYDETVLVPRGKENVMMYGDGMDKTIVTGNPADSAHVTKLQAVFAVDGQNFIAKNMGFRNTAGAIGWPAVAVRTGAEYITFYKCQIDGYQDTLYTLSGRQFFRDCTISGTIDFIFGNAAVVFQNCKIVVNTPQSGAQNVITANGRTDPNMNTGIVFHGCQIIAAEDFKAKSKATANYLGRPWKDYSRTIIMESTIGELIHPEGWMPWMNSKARQSTVSYAEYGNKGPGATPEQRVKWPGFHMLSKSEAAKYTVESFIDDNGWLASTGIPTNAGLMS
ncbi:hypothetical protein LUZ63_016169 [Rhynchospora breviuscula]|uniref:Pectinesterase n=1 Tax=Rhynchospora breviuscula TaxID=2022672 RepID=A0A9Q0CEG8_9POAL|nr:hypothetical protein LUZ63_016169 [Rhynchospora breviuscula]